MTIFDTNLRKVRWHHESKRLSNLSWAGLAEMETDDDTDVPQESEDESEDDDPKDRLSQWQYPSLEKATRWKRRISSSPSVGGSPVSGLSRDKPSPTKKTRL